MSDIRFNRWLHQSGTGGVYQDSSGRVGIGSSVPTSVLDVQSGNIKIGSNTLSSSGVSTFTAVNATTFTGNLTGNINSSGVSTFTNGPVLIGSGTSTGTASQRLQVTGGAYVSGSLGIGLTNSSTKFHVSSASGSSRQLLAKFDNEGQQSFYVEGQWGSADIGDSNGTLLYSGGAFGLRTGTSGNANLLIDSSGRLGIGTNNPQAVLHTVASGEVARFQATNNPYVNFYNGSTNTAYIQSRSSDFRLASSSGIPIVFFPGDGSDKVVVNSYGVSSRNFNRAWEYYNADNTPRTFTWLNVFNQIYTGTGGRLLQNNGAAYRFYLTGNNGRHLRIYEGVVHIGDIATYGASTSAINVSSISEIVGPFPGGCGNPFSSVSTTGFTYNRGDCFQNANVFLNGLANIYNSIETVTGTP